MTAAPRSRLHDDGVSLALIGDSIGAHWIAPTERAYAALQRAAERIGANNYRAQIAAHKRSGRKDGSFRFAVSEAHQALIDAMTAAMGGEITPEQAMALLHEYDAQKERLG